MQEDAFITLRTARHLAEHGDFSFNLAQHFPGTTSLLYPVILAGLDLLLRGGIIPGAQWFGIFCVVGACYLAARALSERPAEWLPIWLLSACWPIALIVSYTGMETPMLLLTLGAAMYALGSESHPALFASSMFLLPLIRPDALAYGIVFCAAMLFLDRVAAIRGVTALGSGGAVLLLANRLISGRFLPTTAPAKEIAYHPSHAITDILGRLYDVFLHQSFLLPIPTTYLAKLSPVLLAVVLLAFVIGFRNATTKRSRILLGTLAFLIVAVPAAYAAGGVIFAWYLYPVNWLAVTVAIAVGVRLIGGLRFRRLAYVAVGVVWIGLISMQWAKALVDSTQDYHYHADVGRYLADVSHGKGTLFLEPAGYIPYYSGLYTDDEVGLVSPRITGYMTKDPEKWWIDYVEDEKPDYIVQRQDFERFKTFEGYTLSAAEQRWFTSHYRLLRRLHYVPSAYHPSPSLQRIFSLGPIGDYLIYERRSMVIPQDAILGAQIR